MNCEQVFINCFANSVKIVDIPSRLCEVPVQAEHAFSFKAGLQLAGASSTHARANEPFRSTEFGGETLLIQDASGPVTLRPRTSPESSASAEGSLHGKSFAEQQSLCTTATSFTDEQWVSSPKSLGQPARQSCSAGGPNDAKSSAQHFEKTSNDRSKTGWLQSASNFREVGSEGSGSFSSRTDLDALSTTTGRSGATVDEPQQSKQPKLGETSTSERITERSQFSEEFSEPRCSNGKLSEWKQQQSTLPKPGSGECKLTESVQSPGIPFQRATVEKTSHGLGCGSLGREAKQASTTWESSSDGSTSPSGLLRNGFHGNATSTDGCPTKDIAGQGQSAERDSTAVGQRSPSAVTRSADSNGKGLPQSYAQQYPAKVLGAPSSQGLPKSQGCAIHERRSNAQGSPINERSLPTKGAPLIKGSSSIPRSSPVKRSPLLEGSIEGQSFIPRSSNIEGSTSSRRLSEGSSSNQGSFAEELPELQRSSTIEGPSSVEGFSSIQEPSSVERSCINQGSPPVTESFSAPGTGSPPIPGQLPRRGSEWSGKAVTTVGGGSTSSVSTRSSPSSSVGSTSPAKPGTWSTTFAGSSETFTTQSTRSTLVGSFSPVTHGGASPNIDQSLPTIHYGSCTRTSVQTLSGISVGSSSQINAGTLSGSFQQSATRASVGSPSRVSSRTYSGTSAGSPPGAASGTLSRASVGSPSRASVGSPSRTSAGSPSRASTGSPSRASTGSPSRTSARTPPGTSDGLSSGTSAQSSWGLAHGAPPRTPTESPTREWASSSTTLTEPCPITLGTATPTAVGATTPNLAGLSRSHGQTTVSSSISGDSAGQTYRGSPQLASATTAPQSSIPVEQEGSLGTSTRGASDSTTSCSLESRGESRDGQHAWERTELGTDERETTATTQAAKGIKVIDKAAVHHICSGQVVVSLATAVKELVENSLDAGSSSVEVRLTGCGANTITVTDDGPGVHPNDFQALALKHHTSKLSNFNDLAGVETFGFRGEALSSLCALSKLVVCTRHQSQAVGSALVYDSNGVLAENKPVSRQVGTTVTLSGLFTSLPVRRREFERNIKKEYHKLLQVLQSYAIIATNVRLHVSNQTDAGSRRHAVLSTSGYPTLLENVTAVFGAKQVSSLVPLQQCSITEEELTEYRIPRAAVQDGAAFTIEGLISSSRHGGGRSAPDRQFYFVNSRPCDPVKVTRLVNEVYRSYNRHQYPCVVLNIITERQSVDVNLTPDKRQVMVHHEKQLLATLKSSLRRLFDDTPNTISLNTIQSATKTKPSRAAGLQQYLSPHTESREVATSSDNTASPLLCSFKRGSNTASPKQSKLSRLKQLCIASPTTGHDSQLPDETASQSHSPMSMSKATSLPSTPQTPTLSSGNRRAQFDTVNKGSPLVGRGALFGAPATPPSGSVSQNKEHYRKSDSSHNNNSSSTSLVHDEPQHCTAANSGSNDRADHHSPGRSNKDTRATSSKRAIADDELPMPVQKRPRLDLSVDANKGNDVCLINVEKHEGSDDADPEIMQLPAGGPGSEGRVEDDSYEQSEKRAVTEDCVYPSSLLEKKSDAAAEDDSFWGELEPMEELEANITVPAKSTPIASTSRKSIDAHGATDSFLNRLLAFKKEPCVRNASDGECNRNRGTNVRSSLKKFLHPRFAMEVDEEMAKNEDDDYISITFDGTNQEKPNESIIHDTAPEAEESSSVAQSEPFVYYDDEVPCLSSRNRKAMSMDCSLPAIRQALRHSQQEQEKARDKKIVRHFHAKIVPTDNKTAEDELNKVLSKDMFAKMQILGQFNLGFIITRLQSDLFIVDQHATDEKYNFETLQQTCVLQHQPLITPLDLELTPGNEAILLDNLDVFVTNGFQFDIDETRPFGQRVKLKSVPQSRNWSFGKEDVDELIFMLSDSPGSMCRPSRVRDMFASRACRKSVMVGTALTAGRMRELVDHMGKIEQPWNCPHGRPTVRHLVNLDMISHEISCLPEKATDA